MKKPNTKKRQKSKHAPTKEDTLQELSALGEIREELDEKLGHIVQKSVKDKVVGIALEVYSQEIFSGPLPHPKHIQAYEDACPGMADRIMSMAEKAQDAQLEIPGRMIEVESKYRNLGLMLGFATLVVLAGGATFCAYTGHPKIAAGFLTVGALGTVGRFIDGRLRSEKPNNNEEHSQADIAK